MSRVCLQFVIVVFPDHTHLLFLIYFLNIIMLPGLIYVDKYHWLIVLQFISNKNKVISFVL